MYDEYYGFSGRPFQLTPDPVYYFESTTHRKAMSYLGYGLAQGEGFIVVTGEIGAGKTTLVAHLMVTIDPRRLTAVQIVSTQVGGDDMLRLAAQGFGIATVGLEKAQLLQRLESVLHQQARAGKRSLLIVDEAQNLSPAALEELRMLSNFQLGGQSLLQIFLLGQPEFRTMINGEARLEQLRQRVIATHHLEAMLPEEVAPYIEHRLRIVDWTGNPRFTPDAYAMLARESAGVPRRLNALVSRVLLLGAIDHLDLIDGRVVEAVVADASIETQLIPTSAAAPEVPDVPAFEPELPPQSDDMSDLEVIRNEVRAFSRALYGRAAESPGIDQSLAARVELIERRLGAVEQRSQEQDEALRRVLAKLIEWAERDVRNGPFSNRAA
jgi:putative secretion ATPase (PEP-CTERM system associated)